MLWTLKLKYIPHYEFKLESTDITYAKVPRINRKDSYNSCYLLQKELSGTY